MLSHTNRTIRVRRPFTSTQRKGSFHTLREQPSKVSVVCRCWKSGSSSDIQPQTSLKTNSNGSGLTPSPWHPELGYARTGR
ncbi:hypothetical protein BaRGS_00001511 [Batillaria attramentaria]|uniref:Uncharacterized protein n=1 Tax=Batillaria attramentaria TaxID=370345 RepID=A0ABD0M871_9CAEN